MRQKPPQALPGVGIAIDVLAFGPFNRGQNLDCLGICTAFLRLGITPGIKTSRFGNALIVKCGLNPINICGV